MSQKTTTPLAKAYTTLEGQIVSIIVVACGVAASLNPAQFPPQWAGTIAAVSAIALVIQRLLIKTTAIKHGAPSEPVQTKAIDAYAPTKLTITAEPHE